KIPGEALCTKNRKCRPSGRNPGILCDRSPGCTFVTAAGSPPAAETRNSGLAGFGAKTIFPSGLQLPPLMFGALQSVRGGPPAASTFFSFPSALNAIKRLSGDQNAKPAPSVPG